MKKQNICMVFIGQYPLDVRVRREAEALQNVGFNVHVICVNYPDQLKTEVIGGITIHRLNIRQQRESKLGYLKTYFLFTFLAFFKVLRLHWKKNFRVVHVHNVPDILVMTAMGAKIFGAKTILDMHEIMPEFFQRKYSTHSMRLVVKILKFLEKLMIRLTDHVIVAAPFWKKTILSRSAKLSKVTTILNLTDQRYFHNKKHVIKKSPRPFKLIYPGTFSYIHGVDIAIRAVKMLVEETEVPVELFLYGTGDEESNLQKLIQDLKLEEIVHLRKEVPIDQLGDILKEMDCGIVPKRDGVFIGEAMSTKMFDFAAIGLPTICSRTIGDTLYFDDSMVLFFEPENVKDLARCIQKLYEDYQLRLSLAKNISALHKKMNWETEQRKLIDIYARLTSVK